MKKILIFIALACLSATAVFAGDHYRSDGSGGYYSNEGHYRSDGSGGYYTPDGGHQRSDGKHNRINFYKISP